MFTIPNIITLVNLIAGCLALVFLSQDAMSAFFITMAIALIADVLDGAAARMFNQAGPIGKQLDSLADVVSFGVVPGLVMSKMIMETGVPNPNAYWPFVGLLLTAGAALRLAKFNIATNQEKVFRGLPTPAMAIYVIGIYHFHHLFFENNSSQALALCLVSTIGLFILMLSNMPFISLKNSLLNIKENIHLIIVVIAAIGFFIFLPAYALTLSIVVYIILSCFKYLFHQTTV